MKTHATCEDKKYRRTSIRVIFLQGQCLLRNKEKREIEREREIEKERE